eukprot:Phypoly_transcript_18497.p1 GENE.Phypoly_transcript_18497~~Phypoly_transcript_18497.p1  ORF type:complete len:219 (+),score=22.47 Phypoly_transcript_18497:26-682(+)
MRKVTQSSQAKKETPYALQLDVIIERILQFSDCPALFKIGRLCKQWSDMAKRELHSRGPYLNFSDGLYKKPNTTAHSWIRFYKERNYVCNASCGADIHSILRWLHNGNLHNSLGRWEYEWHSWRCKIKFATFSGHTDSGIKNKGEVREWGFCTPTKLILSSKSMINNYESQNEVYKFIKATKPYELWPDGSQEGRTEAEQRKLQEKIDAIGAFEPLKW